MLLNSQEGLLAVTANKVIIANKGVETRDWRWRKYSARNAVSG